MAIITDYTIQRGDDIENYPSAYLRIQKIQTTNAEYEYFKNVDDPNRPDVAQEIDWTKRIETQATCFIWADALARKNRAQSIDWFVFEFDYDLNSLDNIYQQGYAKLREIFTNSEDIL